MTVLASTPGRVDAEVYLPRVALEWLETAPEQLWQAPEGSLVFADVTGFTPMTEKLTKRGKVGAEELTDILNDVFGRLLDVAADQAGDLLKFGGDALLLMFTGEHHVLRAAAAAAGMLRALRPFKRLATGAGTVSLTMSAGVATGPCHLYLVGGSHRELLVAGPVVSQAVALEADAAPGQVLLSPAAARQLPERLRGDERASGVLLRGTPPAVPVQAVRSSPRADPEQGIPVALRDHLRRPRDAGEHRIAVLTFLQFKGSDALLARRGPDAVATALDGLVRDIQDACASHDVTFLASDVDRDGGKVLLAAGAPRSCGADADATLHALREVVARRHDLAVRAGVNVGRTFAVDVGAPYRRTYAVMGDATNLAARVMSRAPSGAVVATQAVLDRLSTAFALEPLEPFPVKGKSELVHAQVVGAVVGAAARRTGQRLPLTGRDEELTQLVRALDDVRGGRGSLVELVGEAGTGKSRLADETAQRATGLPVLRVEAGQYASTTPYLALRGPLLGLLGLPSDADDAAVEAALHRHVDDRFPDLAPLLPLLGIVLGLDLPHTSATVSLDPAFLRDSVHAAIDDLLTGLLPGPALVVVDGAHWLDEASVQLVQRLVASLPARPWLVIVSRRSSSSGRAAPPAPDRKLLELRPLSPDATLALVSVAAGDTPMAPHVRRALAERSGGNPLFATELVDAALSGSDPDSLPDSVEATIAASIDQVPALDRDRLRRAAVLGPRFRRPILAAMLEDDGTATAGTLDVALQRLERFLVVDGDDVRFRHGLVRDVAYEGLAFRYRKKLHGRAGDLVAQHAGDDPDEVAGLLSTHYHAAARYDESWHWSREAAGQARRAAAPVEAAGFLRRALESARHLDVDVGDLSTTWEELGDVCESAGLYDEAAAAYARARRLVAGRPRDVVRLCQKEGWLRERSGAYSAALRWYTRGLRLLESERASFGRTKLAGQLLMACAAARLRQGRYAESLPLLEQVVRHARKTSDLPTLAHAYYLLDWAHTDLGNDDCEQYRTLALPIYEQLGDWAGQANVLNNLGVNAYFAGRWDEAVSYYLRAGEARKRAGDIVQDVTASNNIGEILSDQGRLDEATRLFREALSAWRAANYPIGIALATSNLGRAAVRRGELDAAQPLLAEARAGFAAIGATALVLETDAREVERLVHQGRPAAAFTLAEATAARGESTGGLGVLCAMLDRLSGYALVQVGQRDEGLARLRRSVDRARAAGADFEIALGLLGVARVSALCGPMDGAAAEEAADLLARLDVVAVPVVPLTASSA